MGSLEDVQIEVTPLNDVVVPPQLSARAQDDRGLPIPGVTAVVDVDPAMHVWMPTSFVDFDFLDWNAWAACVNDNRCGYCRHPLEYWMFFVGHQSEVYTQVFVNPPIHDACAHYFLQVYPAVFFPRMRSGPISEGGELPVRLGVYKARGYKVLARERHGGFEATSPNYVLKAGTQKGSTLWVDYPREAMQAYNDRDKAVRALLEGCFDSGRVPSRQEMLEAYMQEGKGVH